MTVPPLVLFDLDDTLCDYSGARTRRLRQAYGDAFAAAGITHVDLEAVVAESITIHPHGSDHFPNLLLQHGVTDAQLAARARRWYGQNRFLGLDLFVDARDVLDAVRAMPDVASIGLITNGPADVQREKIGLLDLWPHIDFAVISGEVGVEKPDRAIFWKALETGKAVPEDAIYIGDSPEHDMDGAFNAGIPRIWMNRSGAGWPLDTLPPEREARTLTDLLSLLESL